MISDVLSEAVDEIKAYLEHPVTAPCYDGEIRFEILELLNKMENVRKKLDEPLKPIYPCICRGFYKPADCPVHGTRCIPA